MQRTQRMMLKTLSALAVAAGVFWLLAPSTTAVTGYDQTYTLDADFDQGMLFNVNHDSPNNDQLQLNEELSTFPLMWVANAGEDTVSKIDTSANMEVGRYRSWYPNPGGPYPHGSWTGPAPSRTAVDADGNAYVLNRHFGPSFDFQGATLPASVMKVLASGFIDRNGDGDMDTAVDTNSDGVVSLAETMAMGPDINGNGRPDSDSNGDSIPDAGEIRDERIAWIAQVGVVNGLGRAICMGTDGNPWVGLFNQRAYYKISASTGATLSGPIDLNVFNNGRLAQPYGCAVDGTGRLFSANIADFISQIDTGAGTFTANRIHGGTNYGITVGGGLVYVADLSAAHEWRTYDPAMNTTGLGPVGNSITVSLDGAGNIFVGSQNGSTRKYSSGGVLLWSAGASEGGLDSRGTIIDSDGNVWRIHRSNGTIAKYNGMTGALLAVRPVGSLPYTYSDASGLTNLTETSPFGTWTVVQDSGAMGTLWDTVTWNGMVPDGGSITARVRASDMQGLLSSLPWTSVTSGGPIAGVVGQYIEVEVRLEPTDDGDSPVLEDVRVQGHPPNSPPDADAGEDEMVSCSAETCQGEVMLDGSGSSDPDMGDMLSYSWSGPFGTATGQQVTVLVPQGMHTITLTVTDSFGETDTDEVVVTAVDDTPPTITAPESITVSQTSCTGTMAMLGEATAADACGPATVSSDAPASYPLGTTFVTFTATDTSGNQAMAMASVTVVDATGPLIGSFSPSVTELWPPNHRMVPVTFSWTVDDCDVGTTCSIVSVASNEPVNDLGDGNTAPDWEITGTNTVMLRSERQGPESGRIYTITLRCVDSAGNESTRTTTVTVPHDRR